MPVRDQHLVRLRIVGSGGDCPVVSVASILPSLQFAGTVCRFARRSVLPAYVGCLSSPRSAGRTPAGNPRIGPGGVAALSQVGAVDPFGRARGKVMAGC